MRRVFPVFRVSHLKRTGRGPKSMPTLERTLETSSADDVFGEVRFSHGFQNGLTAMFFHDDEKLRDLTIFYGVF